MSDSVDRNSFQKIKFQNDFLWSMRDEEGRYWVLFSHLCKVFDLDPVGEWRKVQSDRYLMWKTVSFPGGEKTVVILAEHIHGWMFRHVRDTDLPSHLQAKYGIYVREAFKAIDDYWRKGVAVNEAMVGPEAAERIRADARQAAANWNQSIHSLAEFAHTRLPHDAMAILAADSAVKTALLLAAGQSGTVEVPIVVTQRAAQLGYELSDADGIKLGQVVARAYRLKFNKEPGKTSISVRGRPTDVNAYSTADVGWLDPVIKEFADRLRTR